MQNANYFGRLRNMVMLKWAAPCYVIAAALTPGYKRVIFSCYCTVCLQHAPVDFLYRKYVVHLIIPHYFCANLITLLT